MKITIPKSLFLVWALAVCVPAVQAADKSWIGTGVGNFGDNLRTTAVLTPTGEKDITKLQIGDEVIAFDSLGQKVINVVEGRQDLQNDNDYILINGLYLLFKNQSVWVGKRVVHAFEVRIGDALFDQNGQRFQVTSLKATTHESPWTVLTISGNHTYIANGLLLHNASRYWVGGGSSATWVATGNTNWGSASNTQDNASVPTTTDDVIFDGVGTGASNSTLSANISIRSLNMTGYANTLTHNAAVTLFIGDATAGASNVALTLSSGMTYTLGDSVTSAIVFKSTSATTQTVTTNGKSLGSVYINDGLVGYWKLDGNLTDSSGHGNTGTGAGAGGANNTPQSSSTVPTLNFTDTNSYSFDGTDDYVSVANESNFDFERTQAFSVVSWIKTSGIATAIIVGKLDNSSPNAG